MSRLKQYINFQNIITIILFIGIIFIYKNFLDVNNKLNRYEEYMSERTGNLIRSAGYGVKESKEILEEIVSSSKIDEIQLVNLRSNNVDLVKCIHELHYLNNRVINEEPKVSLRYIDMLSFLDRIKFSGSFCDYCFDKDNIKEKILTEKELAKFEILKTITNDYSNIFNDGLIYFSTELHRFSDSPYFHIDYNEEIKKGIEIIKKICDYNLRSPYRQDLYNFRNDE